MSFFSLTQVCSDDNSFSLNNLADATTAANAKSEVGTKCYVTSNTAGSTDFSGDWIEISGKKL